MRPRGVRRALVVLVLVGLASTLSAAPPPVAAASCAGPRLDVEPRQLLEDGARTTGDTFYNGECGNSNGCWDRPGCGAQDCEQRSPAVPAQDVVLSLVQGDRTWRLGVAGASSTGGWRVAWTVDLPDDVRPGRARLVTDQPRASVRVRLR